ncbi:MAG: hypothetical protein Q8L48_19625 [Archangium sp.]|nr:hypothetical protein [Archangium sp.]
MPGSVGRSTGLDVSPSHEPITTEATPPVAPRELQDAQVSAWTGADQLPQLAQQSGGLPASQLAGGLTTKVALEELDSLLTSPLPANLGVTADDAHAAVGILRSLSPAQQREVLVALGRDRRLGALVDNLPDDARPALLNCATGSGLVAELPEQHATPRTPQPPPRPALLDNRSTLPAALRELVHGENQRRANVYATRFDAYVAAYCEAVKQAPDAVTLRALGPLSSPPALSESGVTDIDRKYLGWNSALTDTNPGIERAAKEVSNRVSDFRGEVHAGGFSLGLEVTAKATVGKKLTLGGSSSVDLTDDGRQLNQKNQVKEEVSVGVGFAEGSATFDSAGHLKQVKATVVGAGVELDKHGKVTLSFKEGPATVSTFVDGNAAKYGASLGLDESVKFLGVKVSVGAKATVTAQGIAREYYPDIGGKQEGVFGPMPELDQGAAWASLPKERQQWYARQGFTEKMWPAK